jgi:hypothetical protein
LKRYFKTKFSTALCLTIYGSAYVNFTKGCLQPKNHIIREEYLDENLYFFGSKDSKALELPVGVRIFKFAYVLPSVLPHSLEGSYGSITYFVKVTLVRPTFKFNWSDQQPFKVASLYDVKLCPEFNRPLVYEDRLNDWFDNTKPLILKVQLPKKGFALGEEIPIRVELINKSSSRIRSTNFEIKQSENYCGRRYGASKICQETVATARSGGVEMKSETSFDVNIKIPHDLQVSSMIPKKHAFEINYELWISAGGVKIKIPIVIGPVFPL